ncbi:MAG: hypothetical protein ACI4B6_05975 [Atopobiaceae bacterium]
MKLQKKRFDRRDAASLAITLLLAVISTAYWCCFAGQSAYTYNVLPDALYRYIIEPAMIAAASFFLSSHLNAHITVKAASLHFAKIVCLLLSGIYVSCIVAAMGFGIRIVYETIIVFITYVRGFLCYTPVFIGLILGIRTIES